MKFSWLFLLCILCSRQVYCTSKVLIIMGASCSGKSTLASALQKKLKGAWQLIEFDTIEESYASMRPGYEFNEVVQEDLMQEVVRQANDTLQAGDNIIIDTNIYTQDLQSILSDKKIIVFVFCPLGSLLKRNQERNRVLKRDEKRVRKAEEYVRKSFAAFTQIVSFDICIDSSKMNHKEMCEHIMHAAQHH